MNWLQVLGPSLLFVLGGIITWFLKSRAEELRAIEERLREERRKIYGQILDPYIRAYSDIKGQGPTKAIKTVTSYEYKRIAFGLILLGSDEVVCAFNAFVKYGSEAELTGKQDPKEMMRLWATLLLEIRRSLGNKNTKLDELDMLRPFVTDIDREMPDLAGS